ncbi:DUF4190 domain-containing protein [Microbacterium sp. G2-8]|uniref:DUF4190 domain-containing protein n=1 Tax=Microbacterium sp. G2-8 TaxID=2842454 RepID=UPI001C891C4C|nr:DUF4190 domain-containing protein [Microbacterium sp. G2-8]
MSEPHPPSNPNEPVVPPLPDAGQQPPAPPQPPYARPDQPPAYAVPYAQPGSPVPPSANGPYGTPTDAPASGGKGLSVTALVLGIVGFIAACIPFVTYGSWLLIIPAAVIAIVALVKKMRGKGMSITALVLAGIGALISIVMMLITPALALLFALSTAPDSASSPEHPEAAIPGAPEGTTDFPFEIVDQQIWESDDYTNFALIIDNPSEDEVYVDTFVTIEAFDDEGTLIDSANDYFTGLPGETLVDGTFMDASADDIAELNVVYEDLLREGAQPLSDFGTLESSAPDSETDDYGLTEVTGTVTSTFVDDVENAEVSVLVRSSDGDIVAVGYDYIERIPAEGKANYTASIYDELPAGAAYEVYVKLR